MNRLIILSALLSFSVFSKVKILDGLYKQADQFNFEACPQQLKAIYDEDKSLSEVSVVYVGDCFHWGPFSHYCDQDFCTNGAIDLQIINKRSYHWQNLNHGPKVLFQRVPAF